MSEKRLSAAEAITQLAQRRALRAAEAPRRRAASVAAAAIPAAAKSADAVWRHRFRVGQTVTLVPNRYGANRLGHFEVMFLLPQEQGINQYRLKSTADGHERVASEHELD